jgi:hypothetical protein
MWQGWLLHGIFFFFPTGSSYCLPSPPVADSGPFKFASGGGIYLRQTPQAHVKAGRLVFGLVGKQFGWE